MYFNPCRCCGCLATEDDFADDSIAPHKWVEVNASWSETGGQLAGSGDHAIIKTWRSVNGITSIEAKVVTGNIARLILYFEDEDNYLCGQVDKVSNELKIIRRVLGVDTQLAIETGVTVGTKTWRFCDTADHTYALYNVADATENAHVVLQPSPSGNKPGALATAPGSTAATFDDFKFFKPDGSEECPECAPDITPSSCSDLCGESHPDEVTADVTQEPPPNCYGGDQTGLVVSKFGTGDTCHWTKDVNGGPLAGGYTLDITMSWSTRQVKAQLEGNGLPIGLGGTGNALFQSPEGVIEDNMCDDFDVTCTRIGGSGPIGTCFGAGSTVRVYVSP